MQPLPGGQSVLALQVPHWFRTESQGVFAGHWVYESHTTQALLPEPTWLQYGVPASRAAHWPSRVQASQLPALEQYGWNVPASAHWPLVRQSTQRPLVVLQNCELAAHMPASASQVGLQIATDVSQTLPVPHCELWSQPQFPVGPPSDPRQAGAGAPQPELPAQKQVPCLHVSFARQSPL